MPERREKRPCVYIMASSRNRTLYVGATSDLHGRVAVHKQDLVEGFTKRYGVHRLVYYEFHDTFEAAFARETRLKRWNRIWKLRLIEETNPEWLDLFDERTGGIREHPADVARRTR